MTARTWYRLANVGLALAVMATALLLAVTLFIVAPAMGG